MNDMNALAQIEAETISLDDFRRYDGNSPEAEAMRNSDVDNTNPLNSRINNIAQALNISFTRGAAIAFLASALLGGAISDLKVSAAEVGACLRPTVNNLNFRSSPEITGNIIGSVNTATVLEVVEDFGDFVKVRIFGTDKVGYVSEAYTVICDGNNPPVVITNPVVPQENPALACETGVNTMKFLDQNNATLNITLLPHHPTAYDENGRVTQVNWTIPDITSDLYRLATNNTRVNRIVLAAHNYVSAGQYLTHAIVNGEKVCLALEDVQNGDPILYIIRNEGTFPRSDTSPLFRGGIGVQTSIGSDETHVRFGALERAEP